LRDWLIEFPAPFLESRRILTREAADLAENFCREPAVARERSWLAASFAPGALPCEFGRPGMFLFIVGRRTVV
jgi:hypothetical protein